MSAPKKRPPTAPRRQRGLSIIELMVGIVVSLLVGLAASGSAIMFTASQRQGIGAGGVSISSMTALAALKNDAAAAGLGFFGDNLYLCNSINLSNGATVVVDGAPFAPVRITEDGTDDSLDIVYATQVESGANVLLAKASDGSAAELQSYLPVAVDQAVLLAPAVPGDACVVRTVTAVTPSTVDSAQVLAFANSASAPFNQAPFTTAPAFPERGRVAMLGDLRWHRYRLEATDHTLRFERPLQGPADSTIVATNVVALRAQYGISAAGSATLENWQDANGAGFAALDSAELARVRALRIGMVTRSPQREKPDAGGNCESTTAMPDLFGEAVASDVADWQCYRYRVSTVIVPLRNLVYGIKP